MDDRFEQLCLGHLPQLGLKPACKGQEVKNGVGFTFVPDPEIGEGYLWTYPINSTCSLTIYDIVFHENVSFRYYHPAALTIAVSSPGSAEPVFTNVVVILKILWVIFWMKEFFHIPFKKEHR